MGRIDVNNVKFGLQRPLCRIPVPTADILDVLFVNLAVLARVEHCEIGLRPIAQS